MTQAVVLSSTESRDPKVVVFCATYNHRPYIEDALHGFMMQKTDFPVEFLIHDDASTDGTADIVREWHERYPNRITAVLERVNQYSLHGGGQLDDMLALMMRGEYLALCEGDDYWTDPHKLQRQVEALESNPTASMCTGTVKVVSPQGVPTGRTFPGATSSVNPGVFPESRLVPILLDEDAYPFQTSCYMFRVDAMAEILDDALERDLLAMNIDYVVQFLAAIHGAVVYLGGEAMSCYRELTPGGHNDRLGAAVRDGWLSGDPSAYVAMLDRHIRVYRAFDRVTAGRYHDRLGRHWERDDIYRLMALGRFRDIPDLYKGHSSYEDLPAKVRAEIGVCGRLPSLYVWYKRLQMLAGRKVDHT